MKYLKQLLAPPVFSDEAKTEQAYLLHIILWTLVCVPIPYVLFVFLKGTDGLIRAFVQAGFGEIVNIILLVMLHRGYVRSASITQASAFWLFLPPQPLRGAVCRVKLIYWVMDW